MIKHKTDFWYTFSPNSAIQSYFFLYYKAACCFGEHLLWVLQYTYINNTPTDDPLTHATVVTFRKSFDSDRRNKTAITMAAAYISVLIYAQSDTSLHARKKACVKSY